MKALGDVPEGDGLRLVEGGSAVRANRGGGFNSTARFARSGKRSRSAPSRNLSDLGVRPARGITAR